MIRSFKDKVTKAVFNGKQPKGFPPDLFKAAQRKLTMLNAATSLDDLKFPPSNKLHPLTGDRKGQHAIWINTQFRLCFTWKDDGAEQVEIVDYH